jgi:hypothetical protein
MPPSSSLTLYDIKRLSAAVHAVEIRINDRTIREPPEVKETVLYYVRQYSHGQAVEEMQTGEYSLLLPLGMCCEYILNDGVVVDAKLISRTEKLLSLVEEFEQRLEIDWEK